MAEKRYNDREIIKKVNNYLLQKYPHCYIETKSIAVSLSDEKKEKDFATKIVYLKKQYTNIGKNPLYITRVSQSYSEKLYTFAKDAIGKFNSVIELGENFGYFVKEIEEFLSSIFIPQDQSKGYFERYDLSPFVYIGDHDVFAYSIFYEDDVFKFFEGVFSRYELKDPKIEVINHFIINSQPLLSKKANENIYYAKLSFSVHFSIKEIL